MFFLTELPALDTVEGYCENFQPGAAENVLSALTMMRDASTLVRSLEQYFQRFGLSQLRFLILMVIDRDKSRNSMTASEIAKKLDVSKPVLSRTIKSLLADDLLISVPSETDGRSVELALSKKATELLHGLLPDYFKLINQFMERKSQ